MNTFVLIAALYPFLSAIAYRLSGTGKDGVQKRLFKLTSYVLWVVPLVYLYHLGLDDAIPTILLIGNLALFVAVHALGTVYRRRIADSRDFPNGNATPLVDPDDKPFINFDWLLRRVYVSKDVANFSHDSRRWYKLLSFSLNRGCIATLFYYGPLTIYTMSAFPLLGAAFAFLGHGLVYYFLYDYIDEKKKLTFIEGHAASEIVVGFLYGVVDIMIFLITTRFVLWH